MPPLPAFAKTAFNVLYINFAVNGLASIITLCLMFSMWRAGRLKLNIYTKCAIQMAFLQLIYEVAVPLYSAELRKVPFATGAAQGIPSTTIVMTTGGLFWGGMGASAWSMMMLVSVLFTVHYGRQPTPKEQLISGVIVNLLLIAFTVQAMVRTHAAYYADSLNDQKRLRVFNDYLVGRVVLIVLSGICLLRLYQVMLRTSQVLKVKRFKIPLFHLLKRIAPYTIILVVVRFGSSAYHWIYKKSPPQIPANADGWQIFWLYVFVLTLPAASVGLLVAFVNVTAGAKRSLIQMLHLECIFTLPDAPASWSENNNIGLRLDGESTMRPTTVQEEHDRLITMDEDALASAVVSDIRESRMSEMEEGRPEIAARKVGFNAGLHEI